MRCHNGSTNNKGQTLEAITRDELTKLFNLRLEEKGVPPTVDKRYLMALGVELALTVIEGAIEGAQANTLLEPREAYAEFMTSFEDAITSYIHAS
jgi:hypothetical protein